MVFLKLAIALLTGILSALSSDYPPVTLIVTGVLMVLIAAEDVCDSAKKRTAFRIGTAAFALLLGVLSGHWWGFSAAACVTVHPVLGTLAAAAAYAVSAAFGIVSTKMPGVREKAGETLARHVAEIIASAAVLSICVAVLFLLRRLMLLREDRRREEQRRLCATVASEMHERQLNRELAKQSYTAEKNARLTERENISRNIHNNVGHSITAAIMTLDAADMLFEAKPEEARKRMNDANERIRGSLESIRSAVRALDDEDAAVPIEDLRRYLENIVEGFTMDTELQVSQSYDVYSAEVLVPKEHAEFLTGVLRECFSNGVRHGGADRFGVSLLADAGHVKLTVTDNGKSTFAPDNREELIGKGFGLKKIEAYAKRCGGSAAFTNDEGFKTVVELPFTAGV
ncbi:MAG: hypothetical protein J5643_08950 [Lachnospiraceae bacterium]|nr:hypothetical protein [Lachnospiraceae bacterium]